MMQFFIATEGEVPLKRSVDKNFLNLGFEVKVKDIVENFIASEHIYIDISVNPAQISVK